MFHCVEGQMKKFVHCQIPEEILYTYHKDFPPYLKYVLHYLVKLHNYNSCRFQWHIAYETSEYILQRMRPSE